MDEEATLPLCGETARKNAARLKDAFTQLNTPQQISSSAQRFTHVEISGERGTGKSALIRSITDYSRSLPDQHRRSICWQIDFAEHESNAACLLAANQRLQRALAIGYANLAKDRDTAGLLAETTSLSIDAWLEIADLTIDLAGQSIGVGILKRVSEAALRIGRIVRRDSELSTRTIPSAEAAFGQQLEQAREDLATFAGVCAQVSGGFTTILCVENLEAANSKSETELLLSAAETLASKQCCNCFLVSSTTRSEHVDHSTEQEAELRHQGTRATIRLFEDTEACSQLVKRKLPNADSDDADYIAECTNGIPGRAVEMVDQLRLLPRLFVDPARQARLTDEGRSVVRDLQSLPFDELQLRTFAAQDETSVVALGVAALVGSPLQETHLEAIADFVETCGASNSRPALAKHLTETDTLDSDQRLFRFKKPGMEAAAKSYMDRGLFTLHQDAKVEEERLSAFLNRIVAAEKRSLTSEYASLSEALSALKAVEIAPSYFEPSLLQSVRTQLVDIYVSVGDPVSALRTAERFCRAFDSTRDCSNPDYTALYTTAIAASWFGKPSVSVKLIREVLKAVSIDNKDQRSAHRVAFLEQEQRRLEDWLKPSGQAVQPPHSEVPYKRISDGQSISDWLNRSDIDESTHELGKRLDSWPTDPAIVRFSQQLETLHNEVGALLRQCNSLVIANRAADSVAYLDAAVRRIVLLVDVPVAPRAQEAYDALASAMHAAHTFGAMGDPTFVDRWYELGTRAGEVLHRLGDPLGFRYRFLGNLELWTAHAREWSGNASAAQGNLAASITLYRDALRFEAQRASARAGLAAALSEWAAAAADEPIAERRRAAAEAVDLAVGLHWFEPDSAMFRSLADQCIAISNALREATG